MAKQGAGRPRKPLCITTVHREMQMGIAEGLKKWYEPPQEMSQELPRLLACAKEQRLTSASDSPSAEAVLDRGPRATDHICIATLETRRDRIRRAHHSAPGTKRKRVRCRRGDFPGDIHAQYTLPSQPDGWACDCFCLERERRSDQRGGRETSSDHHITAAASAV
jgi:hypothetical protein